MTTFSVLDSILSTKPLALYVKEKYNLGPDTICKVLRTGVNHTYLIIDHERKYVFRVYSHNWRSKTEITEELRLLTLLKENNISVSYPLLDNQNKYIQHIEAPEGLRHAVLFSFAEGDKIRNITAQHCYHIGVLMAQFHNVSINQSINRVMYNAKILTQLPYQYAKEHFPESMAEMIFIKNARDYITTTFEEIDSNKLRYGVIHLDMWYDNMNIEEGSKITVFDFDFCGNGWLIFDIAYCVMQLFNTEPDKDAYVLKLKNFFEGYEKISPISDEEKKIIPLAGLAIWIFYLGVQSQRFNNWSNIFLSKNYLEHYTGMIKSWLEYNNIEIKDR